MAKDKRSYEEYLRQKRHEYGSSFDHSDLEEALVPFFESGERVEVETLSGYKRQGYVGVTTGRKPAFMILSDERSFGSSDLVLSGKLVSVRKVEPEELKEYTFSVRIVTCGTVKVKAQSEDEARDILEEVVEDNPGVVAKKKDESPKVEVLEKVSERKVRRA